MARIGKACSTLNTTLPFTGSLANRISETAVIFNISSKLECHGVNPKCAPSTAQRYHNNPQLRFREKYPT
jgi:hypothetical protein